MSLVTLFLTLLRACAATGRALRLTAIAIFLCATPAFAQAEGIAVTSASIDPAEDGWNLDAAFDVQFSQRLEEAVNRGVPLYFVVEFELSRPRWYWFDEK